ncbi:hypothetical protein RE428_26930 [Marinobacter nanhaiticus D15-8W]|nr:hypothetical protein RE428_26930 [Marinobacter nanhaiticus D15-8W]
MTSLESYPDDPDQVVEINKLEVLEDRGDEYGALIRGFIVPQVSGDYQFFVSSDDQSQFYLSDTAAPKGAIQIASVTGFTSQRQYEKYSSQASPIQSLTAGERYYFELRFKEGARADHFSVAWEGPGIRRQVITSEYLATWAEPVISDEMGTNRAYSMGYRIGFLDGQQGLPYDASFPPLDNDNDGLYDNWEVVYGLDPSNPDDALSDQDDDLLPAADEFLIGTSPQSKDTDNDGIPDGYEYAYGLDPLDDSDALLDMDGDGYSNLQEYRADTDIDDPQDVPEASVDGLVGQYYEGRNFNQFITTRVDGNVNFQWTRQPAPELPADNFSIRWSGNFTAPHTAGSEQYRFTVRTDDGVRLYIDGQLVIEDWRDHGPTSFSHSVALEAGESVPVVMEYYERGGGATAQLNVTALSTGEALPTTEVFQAPDPAVDGAQDSDNDGIPDTWEMRYGLNPWQKDASNVSNASGVTNLEAYQNQLNPWTLNSTSPAAPQSPVEDIVISGEATLSWTAPLTRQDGSALSLGEIDHYEINYGQAPEFLDLSVTVPGDTASYTFENLGIGTWYFTVEVVDTDGLSSPPSEVVSKTVD